MATQLDLSVANCIADPELRAAAQSLGRVLAHQESQAKIADLANNVVQFPLFPEATRPISNDMARSALFSCVQGGDRLLLHHAALAAIGGVTIEFSGEQLNQDDCDTLMQLVFMARGQPLGAFVMVSAYAVLKGLGR
jgi:hypothetical protein